jgi:hypothetical protein
MDYVLPNRIVMKIEATVRNRRAQYSVYVITGPDTSMDQVTTGDGRFHDYDELFAEVLKSTAKLLRKGINKSEAASDPHSIAQPQRRGAQLRNRHKRVRGSPVGSTRTASCHGSCQETDTADHPSAIRLANTSGYVATKAVSP